MITKRPKLQEAEKRTEGGRDEAKIDAFIAGAPDSGVAVKTAKPAKQNKKQISLTIDPELLALLDEKAGNIGMARAAAITLACRQFIERGAIIKGDTEQ
ncbi:MULTISPECIES: CopG family transcriptional regulator [Pseudomonas]|uniref:ribbon-helix-helix domain-containing protein n=1 Tax=Pseudomonas TaxID=286 RepID=UPI0014747795|nr:MULTISPECIES: CopG family transcriptional regulator [Pseudomonas]MBM1204780.1 CopG family transcriptional regulator [Pseudomonas fragi]MBM1204876.1 CopG family transcriptional regulator [Pseudomonas fragi]NMY57956.1 CopG family transcriptional regulator [Pseudomonas sp. WS 5051]